MPTSLTRGLYEALITEGLAAELAEIGSAYAPERSGLRAADAPDRIALHLARSIERALAAISRDEDRLRVGIDVARRVLDTLRAVVPQLESDRDRPVDPAAMLNAIAARLPDGSLERIDQPLIPLLDTTVLTNAPGEPRVGSQILAEIGSADGVDVVMAFIRRTGIAPLLDALRRHCEPLPAVCGASEPHHGSRVRSKRASAARTALPMSKQRPFELRWPSRHRRT